MEENRSYSQENNENQKPKKKKGFYLKIAALAICCAILGGIIGGGIVFATREFVVAEHLLDEWDGHDFSIRGRFNFWSPFHFSFDRFDNDDIRDNLLNKSYIGVSVSESDEPKGAKINAVEKGSPAAKGGLKSGDIITMVNLKKINDGDDLARHISKADVGDELILTVYRNDETMECTVVVGEQSILKWH